MASPPLDERQALDAFSADGRRKRLRTAWQEEVEGGERPAGSASPPKQREDGEPLFVEEELETEGGKNPLASSRKASRQEASCSPSAGELEDSLMALLLPAGPAFAAEAAEGEAGEQAAAGEAALEAAAEAVSCSAAAVSAFDAAATEAPQVTLQNVIASGLVVVEGRSSASLDLRRIAVSCRFAEYNPRKINACIVRLRKPKSTGLIFRSGRLMVTGAKDEEAALRAARLLVRMLQAVLSPSPMALAASAAGEAATQTPETEADTPAAPAAAAPAGGGGAAGESSQADAADGCRRRPSTEASAGEASVAARDLGRGRGAGGGGRSARIRLTQFAIENVVATADCGLPVRLEGLAFDHKEFCSYEPELFAGLVYRYSPTPSLKAVLLIFVSGKVVITGCKSAAEIQEVFHSFFPVLLKYHT